MIVFVYVWFSVYVKEGKHPDKNRNEKAHYLYIPYATFYTIKTKVKDNASDTRLSKGENIRI